MWLCMIWTQPMPSLRAGRTSCQLWVRCWNLRRLRSPRSYGRRSTRSAPHPCAGKCGLVTTDPLPVRSNDWIWVGTLECAETLVMKMRKKGCNGADHQYLALLAPIFPHLHYHCFSTLKGSEAYRNHSNTNQSNTNHSIINQQTPIIQINWQCQLCYLIHISRIAPTLYQGAVASSFLFAAPILILSYLDTVTSLPALTGAEVMPDMV